MSEGTPESQTGAPAEGQTEDQDQTGSTDSGQPGEDQGTGAEDLEAQLQAAQADLRKVQQQARINAKKAAQWDRQEDANKSELQRAEEARQAAEGERDAAIASHNRVIAAATHDLPVELIEELGTGTEEEIDQRAELFAKVINDRAKVLAEEIARDQGNGNGGSPGTAGSTRPVESMRPGASPASGSAPRNNDEWFREMLGNSRR